mmetsp:Transcript_31485/g.99833  ORF Transcript_31485/g.99833 Transcript_31485/m.99833 type:complete len:216 (-) Transcript_31485:1457-2104(-)
MNRRRRSLTRLPSSMRKKTARGPESWTRCPSRRVARVAAGVRPIGAAPYRRWATCSSGTCPCVRGPARPERRPARHLALLEALRPARCANLLPSDRHACFCLHGHGGSPRVTMPCRRRASARRRGGSRTPAHRFCDRSRRQRRSWRSRRGRPACSPWSPCGSAMRWMNPRLRSQKTLSRRRPHPWAPTHRRTLNPTHRPRPKLAPVHRRCAQEIV